MAHSSDVLQLYAGLPLGARFHTWLRWRLFDFPALARHLPEQGTLLDIGCGHGLWSFYAARVRPQLQVWGIDPDVAKIALARHTAESHHITTVHFEVGLAEQFDLPACDIASIIDVMYLIPFEQQAEIVGHTARHLRPGGRLLLKEMSEQPAWKAAWNMFEETLSVKILRITYGAQFFFRPEAEWVGLLEACGLTVMTIRMDRGSLHPHVLFIGEKR